MRRSRHGRPGRRCHLRRWRSAGGTRRRWSGNWRRDGRRRYGRRRSHRDRRRRGFGRGRNRPWRSNRSWRSWRGRLRGRNGGLDFMGRRRRRTSRRRRRSRSRGLLLANDRLQHVSWLGNVRKIDLGLDLFRPGVARARCRLRRSVTIARTAEVRTHLFCFMLFEGTGMRLLLSDAYFR